MRSGADTIDANGSQPSTVPIDHGRSVSGTTAPASNGLSDWRANHSDQYVSGQRTTSSENRKSTADPTATLRPRLPANATARAALAGRRSTPSAGASARAGMENATQR